MTHYHWIKACIIFLLFLPSCTESSTTLIDPAENAAEFCGCAKKAATLILKMKSVERMDTVLYNSVNEAIDEMETCMGELPQVDEKAEAINKLGSDEKAEYEVKYYEALDQKCPNVSKAFNSLQADHVH